MTAAAEAAFPRPRGRFARQPLLWIGGALAALQILAAQIMVAAASIVINFSIDMLYYLIDPRMRAA